jgi:RNA polymerase sigma factor (sigma-70 family)
VALYPQTAPPTALTEKQLVQHLMQGRSRLVAYIWSIVRDLPLAEDIYQDLCGEAVEKRPTIESEEHLANWLRRGARFRAIDALRSRQSKPLVFDHSIYQMLEDDLAADAATGSDLHHALNDCLDTLGPDARQMIRLRYDDNLSGPQIAQRVGRKLPTVYVTFTRIHRTLAECIRARLADEA